MTMESDEPAADDSRPTKKARLFIARQVLHVFPMIPVLSHAKKLGCAGLRVLSSKEDAM